MKAPWLNERRWVKKPNGFNYSSRMWVKLRNEFIKANPFCVECLKKGLHVDCTGHKKGVVDHIREISNGGNPWDWDNLQTLCFSCHQKKSSNYVKRLNKSI